jgi:exosortase
MNAKRHAAFTGLVVVSMLLFSKTLEILVAYALQNDSSSHILIVPFISLYIFFVERRRVFAMPSTSIGAGTATLAAGVLVWIAGKYFLQLVGDGLLSMAMLSFVLILIGEFLLCYGVAAFRAGIFPALFLLLMIPLPDIVLDKTIYTLQRGSTEIAYGLFKMAGVPVLRQGFLLSVPGVTIEVARECSSIRSSIALFITCLVAAHFYLRTWWKMLLFAVLSLPLAMIKNGIRIATLTLLSIYVDPSFLKGNLHREGGFLFFILALVMMWPVLVLLQKSERSRASSGSGVSSTSEAELFEVRAQISNP